MINSPYAAWVEYITDKVLTGEYTQEQAGEFFEQGMTIDDMCIFGSPVFWVEYDEADKS